MSEKKFLLFHCQLNNREYFIRCGVFEIKKMNQILEDDVGCWQKSRVYPTIKNEMQNINICLS